MSKPKNYQVEAVVIKKVKLGEADRILTLYTPCVGKIQGVARGVRRPRSKMSGHLELLTHSTISLARGRNLDTVTGSQTIDSFFPLVSDLELNSYALYAIELINQFTADSVENKPLFHLLLDMMKQLCDARNVEVMVRCFELHLLELVGYRPHFECCILCRSSLKPVGNYFSDADGGVVCPGCAANRASLKRISVNAIKVLRWLQDVDIVEAERLKIAPELSRELESIMRGYVKYLLEKDVKSTAWLDMLRE
ncbi:MAG: DNA repair protein RecO [Dehalococcoidales bacterium]